MVSDHEVIEDSAPFPQHADHRTPTIADESGIVVDEAIPPLQVIGQAMLVTYTPIAILHRPMRYLTDI